MHVPWSQWIHYEYVTSVTPRDFKWNTVDAKKHG
jgi:hypothetical protein